MRSLAFSGVVAAMWACSSSSPSSGSAGSAGSAAGSPAAPALQITAPQGADLTPYIPASATALTRSDAEHSPILGLANGMFDEACWTALTAKVRAAYQLQLAAKQSLFVFDGDLPQAEVEACIPHALAHQFPVALTHEGDLTVFTARKGGAAYVAWRGSLVLVGAKELVAEALAPHPPELAARWRPRLASLGAARFAFWSSDALPEVLFGAPTTSYRLVMTRLDPTPLPAVEGDLVLEYADAAAAATVAKRIAAGDFQTSAAPPADLVEAFEQMPVRVDGAAVTVHLDFSKFTVLDLQKMQTWVAQLTTNAAASHQP